MSEVETEQESVAGSGGATPLDAILESGASVPHPPEAPSQEPDSPPTADAAVRDDEPLVPLQALHRERERRQKMDAKVKDLEEEIQRFNEQKWGLEHAAQPEQQSAPQPQDDARRKEWERRAFVYAEGYGKFVADHGKDKVAAIDAAIRRLSPPQRAHIAELISSGPEDGAVERVHQYVQQLGLVGEDFKPAALKDVLSGKKADAPKAEAPAPNPDLEARERTIHEAANRAHFIASRTEFVSEFGRTNFERAKAAWDTLMSRHPEAAKIEKTAYSYDNPLLAAAQIMNHLGVWSPEQAAPQRSAPQLMPSNLAAARSTTSRNGPAFSGPTPLTDIFKR